MPYEHDAPLPAPGPPTPPRFGPFAPLQPSWQGAIIGAVLFGVVFYLTGLAQGPEGVLVAVVVCTIVGRALGWAIWARRRES